MYDSTPAARAEVHLRPFTFADIPATLALYNAHFPEDPGTVEEVEYEERNRDPGRPFRQLIAEVNGVVVGFGNCGLAWGGATRHSVYVVVAPDQLRRGIGRQLMRDLLAFSQECGEPLVRSGCQEDRPASISFLEAHGFHQIGKRIESELDLTTFDETPFLDAFDRAAAAGITFTTFDQERAPDATERLFALHKPLIQSVPFPGGDPPDETLEDWKRETFESPHAGRDQTVVAKRGDEYVGYSSIWVPEGRPAVTIMTGVHPDVRRHGVALALKLMTIRIARRRGAERMATTNDTANPGILKLNQRMGYQPRPARLIWERALDG